MVAPEPSIHAGEYATTFPQLRQDRQFEKRVTSKSCIGAGDFLDGDDCLAISARISSIVHTCRDPGPVSLASVISRCSSQLSLAQASS